MEPRVATAVAVGLASAAVWTYVGWRIARRDAEASARTALTRFAVFWWGIAGHTTLTVALVLPVPLGFSGAASAWVAAGVAMVLIAGMFWGLMSYLAYAFTGRRGAFRVVTALYALQFVGLVAYISALGPVGLEPAGGTVLVVYADEAGAVADAYVTLVFLVPALLGVLLFLVLGLRTPDRTQRYRALLVGLGLLLWIGAAVAGTAGAAVPSWLPRGLGVVAPLATLAAYAPPAFLRERFGIRALGRHEALAVRRPAEGGGRNSAFEERLRNLI